MIASGKLLYDAGSSTWCSVTNFQVIDPAYFSSKYESVTCLESSPVLGIAKLCISLMSNDSESESECRLVVSNSLRPHGLYSPWSSLGQSTGVGSLSLLQGIFLIQGLNPGLPHCRRILYQLSHKRSP